MRLDIKE